MFNKKQSTSSSALEIISVPEIDFTGNCHGKIIDLHTTPDVILNKKIVGFVIDEHDIRIYFYRPEEEDNNNEHWNNDLNAKIFINNFEVEQQMLVYFNHANPLSDKRIPSVHLTPDSDDKTFSIEAFIKNWIAEQKENLISQARRVLFN